MWVSCQRERERERERERGGGRERRKTLSKPDKIGSSFFKCHSAISALLSIDRSIKRGVWKIGVSEQYWRFQCACARRRWVSSQDYEFKVRYRWRIRAAMWKVPWLRPLPPLRPAHAHWDLALEESSEVRVGLQVCLCKFLRILQ